MDFKEFSGMKKYTTKHDKKCDDDRISVFTKFSLFKNAL
jgi:hypothetical protein